MLAQFHVRSSTSLISMWRWAAERADGLMVGKRGINEGFARTARWHTHSIPWFEDSPNMSKQRNSIRFRQSSMNSVLTCTGTSDSFVAWLIFCDDPYSCKMLQSQPTVGSFARWRPMEAGTPRTAITWVPKFRVLIMACVKLTLPQRLPKRSPSLLPRFQGFRAVLFPFACNHNNLIWWCFFSTLWVTIAWPSSAHRLNASTFLAYLDASKGTTFSPIFFCLPYHCKV